MYTSNSSQPREGALSANVILTPRKAAFFCLIVWFLYLCTLKNGCEFWNVDGLFCLTLAKSLVSLEGYKILGTPHTLYPFGFPFLLAPIVGIFGYNFLVINIFLPTLAVFALFVCFILLRRTYLPVRKQTGNVKTADIAILLTGIAYFFWSYSCNWIIYDIPYFLFSLLTLIVAGNYFKDHTTKNLILLSLLILASHFTSAIGIALLAAVIILSCKEIIEGRKGSLTRTCVILLICCSVIFLWFVRVRVLTTTTPTPTYKNVYDSQRDRLANIDTVVRVQGHFIFLAKDIASTITSVPKLSFNLRYWWYLICFLFISGFLYSIFKRGTVVEWYLLFYLGILAVWPSVSVRFWYPVIPFLFFYFLEAIYLIKWKLLTGKRNIRWRKITFFALLFGGYFLVFIPLLETQYYESGAWRSYQIIVTFVFVMLYFLMLLISFILAFYSGHSPLFSKNSVTAKLPYLWKIMLVIIVFHCLSMIALRTYLKHQDYGLSVAGKLHFQEMGQWLKQNSNKNDVVMCDDPISVIALSIFSERNCVPFPEAKAKGPESYFWGDELQFPGTRGTQGIIDQIHKENVTYVLIEDSKKSLLKSLRELEVFNKLNFQEIMQVEGNVLFKIERLKLSEG